MRILSFAYTTAPLIARIKGVTRREWSADFAARFRKGEFVQAWDRNPRNGGRQVGVIQLTDRPRLEPNAWMPDSDYEAEGFAYLYAHPEVLPKTIFGHKASREDFSWDAFCRWRWNGKSMWVVRFEIVQILSDAQQAPAAPLAPLLACAGILL